MSGRRSPRCFRLKDILRKLSLNFKKTLLEARETLKSIYFPTFDLLTPQKTFRKALSEKGCKSMLFPWVHICEASEVKKEKC